MFEMHFVNGHVITTCRDRLYGKWEIKASRKVFHLLSDARRWARSHGAKESNTVIGGSKQDEHK